ncbi:MAG: DNA-binding transcriptional regulator GbsR (MarR family) [Planctomycetota bacterium]|jgi:DNA-binding transcriptional regulator GbsR (MarR family)
MRPSQTAPESDSAKSLAHQKEGGQDGASTVPGGAGSPAEAMESDDKAFGGLEEELHGELATFEAFFKTFGFKRIHGRVWGLLVLSGQPLTAKEIVHELKISQGAASATINELLEWGAVSSTFDSSRRCNVHEAVGNTLSIVATVLRRREQVAFEHFKIGATRMLEIIRERNGNKDPRVLTLRSIIATCDLADTVMQLVFSTVSSALGDPQSLLSKAIGTALKVGVGVPARVLQVTDRAAKASREASAAQASNGQASNGQASNGQATGDNPS